MGGGGSEEAWFLFMNAHWRAVIRRVGESGIKRARIESGREREGLHFSHFVRW